MSKSQSVLFRPAPPRARPGHSSGRSDRPLRGLAVAATAATFLLIAVGAQVRATGSGEGCPGWPRCFGRLVPPFTHHPGVSLTNALIEYSHRFTAFCVFVLLALLATVVWRRYRWASRVFVATVAAVGLYVFQAVLGGIVVRLELAAWLVTAHLATAMMFAGSLVYVTVAAFTLEMVPAIRPDRLTRLVRATALGVLALIVVGAYVRGEHAGLAFRDWPLMDGRLFPILSSLRPGLQFTHRALALLAGGYVALVSVRAWRERDRRSPVTALVLVAAGLFLAQVIVGAANVWSRLAPAAVTAHVAVSSLVWGALAAAAAAARVIPGETGVAAAEAGGPKDRTP
jgi:cytochrome c oxidase assembly protein subunit 15